VTRKEAQVPRRTSPETFRAFSLEGLPSGKSAINARVELSSGSASLAICKETISSEEDACADHATNETGGFSGLIPSDSLAEVSRNERAYNSLNGRKNEALGLVFAGRHNELGDHSYDEADDSRPKNTQLFPPVSGTPQSMLLR
jgi:hypothetical protein